MTDALIENGRTPPVPLTSLQLDALRIIVEVIDARGVAPTFRELADEMGIRVSGAHRVVGALADRGWVRCVAGRARAIEVLRRFPMPDFGVCFVLAPHLQRRAGTEDGAGC